MAKATSEKQTPKGDDLAKAVTDMAKDSKPAPNDASASRMQVPPGQTSSAPEAHQEIVMPQEVAAKEPERPTIGPPTTPTAINDPAASRNQTPPQGPTQQPQQAQAAQPTDEQIGNFLEKHYPGITLADIQATKARKEGGFMSGGVVNPPKSAGHPAADDLAGLERYYGPGYVTASKKGDPEVRYFTATTWKNLGGNGNVEGWRQQVVTPPEVLNLKKG